MEAGHVVQNRIAVTDELIESFMTIWRKNVRSGHIAAIALPFFHLQREGFWRLHAYPQYQNWLKAQSSISSIGRLRETVQYASLSADLFELFVNPVSRGILKQTLLFLDTLRDHGWTVIFVESRSTSYIKALRCEQEIVIEPSAECTGNEVICSAEIPLYGKIKKFYHINLLDGSEPILKESSYNRKSAGLLRPRSQLVTELKKLLGAGAKGKEIAERLQISESMVKKLKREYGLSQPRSRPDLNPSGNNYYGPNFMPPRPE